MKKYDSYKPVKSGWINQIPAHWTTIPIKFTIKDPSHSFIDGDWIESKVIESEGIRYLTTGNVSPLKYKEQGTGFISEKTFNDLDCTEVFPGDILISRLNEPIGRACIVPDLGNRIVVAVDNVIYRPITSLYDRKFIVYQMNCFPYAINASFIARGTTMPRISRTILGAIKLCIPPLPEQQAIASYLDMRCGETDKAIDCQRQRITLLQELRQSIITHVVTRGLDPNVPLKDSGVEWIGMLPEHWEIRRLKFTGSFENGLTYSPNDISDENGVLVIRSSNIQHSKLDYDDCVYVNYAPKELMIENGDIIICSRNGSAHLIGKCVYIDRDLIATFGAFMMRYRPFIFNKYAFYLFQAAISYYKGLFSTTTINQLTKGTINQMNVPIPPHFEQQDIASYLDKRCKEIDSSIANQQKQIELLQELKQSIITEAVTEKVKVYEP